MPGFRSIIFAFAGLSKMSYWRFWLIDGIAAGISVPLFIWLGYHFAEEFQWLLTKIDQVKHILLPVVVVSLLGAAWIYIRRRRRAAVVEGA
jgi:membrane protein DedA with SNARE-associated domain